jgi:LeuA allosteric (dimerisation) domain.
VFLSIFGRDGVDIRVVGTCNTHMAASGDARAAAYVELDVNGETLWGVGIDPDISTASLTGIVCAVNGALRKEADQPVLVGAAV